MIVPFEGGDILYVKSNLYLAFFSKKTKNKHTKQE